MRKTFKKILTTALVTTMCVGSMTACGGQTSSTDVQTTAAQTAETTAAQTTATETTAAPVEVSAYNEAPMCKALVDAGNLPSVEDRIPTTDDVMVENVASVGTYGGSYEFAYTKAGWSTGKPIEQGLFRFNEQGQVEPNVAKSWEVNDDATVFTIHLREGMKWSDGEPFTAEDCVFFYDHMCVPETFGKSLWDCFKVDSPEGETTTAKFEKIDDVTFTVTFEYSKPTFIENLAINAKWCFAPAHYMKTILPEFVGEEKTAQIATEMGYADTASLLKDTGYYFWNVPGVPTLNPYVLSTEDGKSDVGAEYYEFVRNPYYWKVDQEGNQLPYIDKIEYTKISDDSQKLLLTLGGEITILDGAAWTDIETLQENADSVGFNLYMWDNSSWGALAAQLQLNQTAKDEETRALFQTKEFREALSICVDREEFSKLISDGWADPIQVSPVPGTLGYSEEAANHWAEYDPQKAQELLEGLGLVKGSDGYYDFPDKDFVLNITSFTGSGADETYVVLQKYFDEAGIKTTYQPVDKDLLNNRLTSNDFDAVLGPVAPAETVNIILRPDTLVPVRNYAAWYGQVGDWYASKGETGVAPTGDLLELCNLYDELKAALTAEEREEIALKMLKLHEENQWIIGYMGAMKTIMVVDSDLKNFKESSVFSDEYRGLGIAHLDTCYFEK